MSQQDRRHALGFAIGIGCVPALLLAGCTSRSEERSDQAGQSGGEVTANEDLMREHGILRRILLVYREVARKLAVDPASIDRDALASAATLFREFGERYHEQLLEEQYIFPLVRKAGGTGAQLIDTLLVQHARGRAITGFILDRAKAGRTESGDSAALADAMTSFSRMYEAHAAREDTVIFPAFKRAIGRQAYEELGEKFEEIEHREFGGDGFDLALDKVTAIESALGLSDLARFTAPIPVAPTRG